MAYKFYELNFNKPLPEDINAQPERFAKDLKDEILLKMLIDARQKKLFGDAHHIGNKGSILKFNFQRGVCSQYYIIQQYDERNFFTRSIRNDDVIMKKSKGENRNG